MISPFFTLSKVKCPSKSVIVPLVVPFTITDAPVTGPKASSTIPDTFAFCCEMSTLGIPDIGVAYKFPANPSAPTNRIKLTGLNLFNITTVFCLFF